MFRSLQRLPLRRCMHTASARPASMRYGRVGAAVGASAVVATYALWRTFNSNNNIAADSSATATTKSAPLTPKASSSPDTLATSHSTALQHEPSINEPHAADAVEAGPEEVQNPDAATAEGTEEEHEGGGAFNPVTGEINWDCPCLGGMAHGICGAQFREAFSCFVFSEKEPKGIDCVEKFKLMQDCFREHPDVYGEDIMDDDDDEELDSAPSSQVHSTQPPSEHEAPVSEPTPEIFKAVSEDTPSTA